MSISFALLFYCSLQRRFFALFLYTNVNPMLSGLFFGLSPVRFPLH